MILRSLSQRDCSTSNRCDCEGRNTPRNYFCHSSLPTYRQAHHTCIQNTAKQRAGHKYSSSRKSRFYAARSYGAESTSQTSTDGSGSLCTVFGASAVKVCTDFVAETLLPTTSGKFRLRGYRHKLLFEDDSQTVSEPTVIMTGNPEGKDNVVVRVHDACFTSEVLGSLKCDCADQLQLAMDYIQEHPGGLVIYLQQEGRGIGLANKIAAYALQEKGLDTVDANRELGLPDDAREYTSVLNILADLDIKSIRLMTNNPRKIEVLQSLGVKVTKRIPCIVTAQKHNLGYLSTKQSKMRHMLTQEPTLDGSYCIWNHDGEALNGNGLPKTSLRRGPLSHLIDERDLRAERRPEVKDVERSIDEQ